MGGDRGSPGPQTPARPPLVGVLAIQGGFEAHERVLLALGARVREVRVPADLEGIDGLVLPGGESTAIMRGAQRAGLVVPLRSLLASGLPALGSCAGLIMLDRAHLGAMDVVAQRNAFGRQIRSFETDIELRGVPGGPMRAVFIRAPWIAHHGPGVDVLASVGGHPVAVTQGPLMAVAFHSELAGDDRLHRWLLARVAQRTKGHCDTAARCE